ncbi:MAG: hypothetical protein V1881_03455 [Candidatus Micrarchaeota archaeon]
MTFAVIEGGDASGKKTQALLLAKRLRAKYMRFPPTRRNTGNS